MTDARTTVGVALAALRLFASAPATAIPVQVFGSASADGVSISVAFGLA